MIQAEQRCCGRRHHSAVNLSTCWWISGIVVVPGSENPTAGQVDIFGDSRNDTSRTNARPKPPPQVCPLNRLLRSAISAGRRLVLFWLLW